MEIFECKSCGSIILPFDDLSYGCPNCESSNIGKYNGIIGQYIMEDVKMKIILKKDIKEGDKVQYCGFYILEKERLEKAGFIPDFYFVEEEELKKEQRTN